jgi:hypothetical protein
MRNEFKFILAIVSLAMMNSSCKVQETIAEIPEVQRIVTGSAEKSIYTSDFSDTSILTLNYNYYEPADSSFKDSVNQMIYRFVQSFTEFEGEDEMLPLNEAFFSNQLDSFAMISDADYDDMSSSLWSLMADITIKDNYLSFLELTFAGWSYTGGAHGNGFLNVHMYDKSTGELLGLEDFFSSIPELTAIAEGYFRKAVEIDADQDLNDAGFWFDENKYHLTNNFFFDGTDLIIFYNTYEVAPYSGGAIEVSIPREKYLHLLKRM